MSNLYPPRIGGVEMVVHNLARGLSDGGHQVTVICSRTSENPRTLEFMDGIEVNRVYLGLPGRTLKSFLAFFVFFSLDFPRLIGTVRARKPDLINLHFVDSAGFYGLLLNRLFAIPLVVSVHGNDVHKFPKESRFQRWILRSVLRRAEFVTGCSQSLLKDALEFEPNIEKKSSATGNGVDLAEFDLKAPFQGEKPYILAVGRLEHKKGFDILLEAHKIVLERFPNLDLMIAGEGVECPRLEDVVKRLNLSDEVKLVGKVERGRLIELFKGCDFFVLPSRIEPLGIVNLEAMAAGKAIVATRVNGVPEIVIDGVNGVLVEPENPWALAEGIVHLLEDGDLREKMGRAGKELVERKYTWNRITEGYLDVFKETLDKAALTR